MAGTQAVCVARTDSVRTGAALSDAHDVRQLVVVDDDRKVLGLVTRAQLLREYLRSDAAIHDEIVGTVLDRIFSLEPDTVLVTVADGIVTLTGQVDSPAVAADVIRTVSGVAGVVQVDNRLTVLPDPPGDRAQPALTGLPPYPNASTHRVTRAEGWPFDSLDEHPDTRLLSHDTRTPDD